MANICTTNFAIHGESEFIQKMYNILVAHESAWVGDILVSLGLCTDEEVNHKNIGDLRAEWCDAIVDYNDTYAVLRFNENSKWYRSDAWQLVLDRVAKLYGENNPIYFTHFYTEECGNVIFETNDNEGMYFPERYCVYIEDEGTEYFETEDALIDHVNDTLGEHFTTIDECEELSNVCINEIEIVDNY